MKMIFRIARMELQKMFYSPIAWLVLIIFAIQTGMAFMQTMSTLVRSSELGYDLQALTYQMYSHPYTGIFNSILRNLYLYIPLLTMGLLSREFGSGSIKLLYSSPVSNKQIILGKFLSMMIFGLVMMLIILITMLLGGFAVKDFDYKQVLTGILGLYLIICTYSAIGLFMSSLTSYQIVAAIGTFATLFVLGQVGRMWQSIEFVRDITYWLSINGRSGSFLKGLICSEDLLYFLLVSCLFIVFTIIRLKGFREKSPGYISFSRYTGIFVVVTMVGYVSTIPSLMVYHDSTCNNVNTLTINSQEVISRLKGKVKITTYINIFDQNFYMGIPSSQNYDLDRFKQYSRFYPNIDFEYKYYYALPVDERLLKSHLDRYKDMTEEQALEKACNIYDLNTKLFSNGKNYISEIDLQSELNRFVRKITTEDGKTSYLRMYNDLMKLPDESQITAAFKRLVMTLPVVGFVKGHGERDLNDFGSRGYFTLTNDKTFRYSFINNGFDFKECELSTPIDNKVGILVISDAKRGFSEQEQKNINDYIDRGGNLVIACDLKRQDNMNPLVERLGVRFLSGQVVEYNKGYTMDLVTAVSTKEGRKLSYQFESIRGDRVVTMPGSVAISYDRSSEFKYTPVFVSDTVKDISQIDSVGCWNELETTDFVDGVAKYNPEKGETIGVHTTALALTRKVGDNKEQRIFILGDADCFSNGELLTNRNGIRAQNFSLAIGMFYWLSNNEVPIDIRRPEPPDDKIALTKEDLPLFNILYKVIIPALFALICMFILLRRKGR